MTTRYSHTRFSKGYNAGAHAGGAGLIPIPIARGGGQGWKCYYEDWMFGDAIASDTADWNVTVETTGTISFVQAGVKLQPKDSTDNSSVLYQWDTANFLMNDNTKKFYLEVAATVALESGGAMAQQEFFAGFTSDQATTAFVGATGVAWTFDDGFGFGQLDGDTTISGVFCQTDVQQFVSSAAAFADGTPTRLGLYYDGTNYLLYQDDVLMGQATRTVFNNDAAMGVTLYIKNGEAKTHDLTVHYIALAQEL